MSAHERIADALRDVADMVDAHGLDDLKISVSIGRNGAPWVHLSPVQFRIAEREDLDAIAGYIGGGLEAGHSRGEFWNVGTPSGVDGHLPSGARARVHGVVRGRPLDLAPLPVRRRRTGGAA